MRDTQRVWTVEDFQRKVRRIRDEWIHEDKKQPDADWCPWFRGEANAEWDTRLRPRLYRHPATTKREKKQLLYADQEIRLEFHRRVGQFVQGKQLDKWERYCLMQAYGAPTRLLDWTDGSLTALYFALNSRRRKNDPHKDADAAVYMLDPWWLNAKTYRKANPPRAEGVALSDWDEAERYVRDEIDSHLLKPKIPLAVDPPYLASRMAAQRAHFTIFGTDLDGLISSSSRSDSRLWRIRIAHPSLHALQKELTLSGISESMLFPDLEGLGRELSHFWEELLRQ